MNEQVTWALVVGFGACAYWCGHTVGRWVERGEQAARRRLNAQIQYQLDKARGNK